MRGCRRKESFCLNQSRRAMLERTAEVQRGCSEPDCCTVSSETQLQGTTDSLTHRATQETRNKG